MVLVILLLLVLILNRLAVCERARELSCSYLCVCVCVCVCECVAAEELRFTSVRNPSGVDERVTDLSNVYLIGAILTSRTLDFTVL